MLCCEGLMVQRRTLWSRTEPEPGLRAGLLSLVSTVQARITAGSPVQVRSVVLVLALLGSLVSVEGTLMEDQEELLVELHNRYRGVVQPSASAMLPLKWDANLKLVAEGYAAKCIWNHNPELEDTGENLFAGTGDLDLERAAEKWFLERLDYNFDNNSCHEDKMCGHYTQMVWADTHRVGCAVHLCAQMEGLDWTEPTHFLVCNYYPAGNYEGERPYVEGEWCSQCPENFQRCENNLCAPEVQPTEAETALDSETDSALDSTPETDPAPLPDQEPDQDPDQNSDLDLDQDPDQDPDQDVTETVDQEAEAVVPPPATESIPPEPLSTDEPGTEEPETVVETVEETGSETLQDIVQDTFPGSIPGSIQDLLPGTVLDTLTVTVFEIVPESVPETVVETGSRTEAGSRPEPEVKLQPKPETPEEDSTGGPAGGAVVHTEQELKIPPPIGGKAPPPVKLTPPPENRGQKQKEVSVEKHKREDMMSSDSVVLSWSWSLLFLWFSLLCL